jgi:carbamoyltransferase
MKVIGFSNGHDKGAVLIEDGKVTVGISHERLSRIKHDGAYSGGLVPFDSINYCLNYAGITYKDIDLFVYSTTEILDDVESQFKQYLKESYSERILFIPHHLAHAYSSFFSSGFEESSVVVADASGSILNLKNKTHHWYEKDRDGLNSEEDWTEGISIFHFNKNSYSEVYKKWIKYPVPVNTDDEVSLGLLYGQGCKQIVYDQDTNSWTAGKLMGLASYADKNIVDSSEDYVKELDNDIFIPCTPIYPKVKWNSDFYSRACVAGIYQKEQERASLILAKIAKNLTKSENICVAGGSFLNCNANEKILNSKLFNNCFFIPPSDDSGIPLGCAWYGYQKLEDIVDVKPLSPYIGKKYTRTDIISSINLIPNIIYNEYQSFDELTDVVTYWLTQNRVIGWFQDGSEIGPRALGNRSIIASPIQPWMKDHINHDIKLREWYRPFAPAVMYEYQNEIFESNIFSPYMLLTTQVKEEWRNKIPSVSHVDGSARHQSVTKEINEKFYNLIKNFYKQTGVPVLLNTSFNGPDEPIVESPLEAINTFLNRNLDFLVVENFLISRY